jgi:hypothetical protein
MHQRMQDIACFHADPERCIRRHAARIAERNYDCDRNNGRNGVPDSDASIPVPLAVAVALPVAVAIRGPPWRAPRLPVADCLAATCENAASCPENQFANTTHALRYVAKVSHAR